MSLVPRALPLALALSLGCETTPPSNGGATTESPAPAAPSSAPTASATPPAPPPEPTTAPYSPAPELPAGVPSAESPKKRPIGTYDDWVRAYLGTGAVETQRPPTLRLPRDLPHARGRIAFVQSLDIHLLDLASGTTKALTRDPQKDFSPSFSADGKHLYFESDRGDMRYRVYVMDADGANVKAVTGPITGKEGRAYAVSPDERLLAYVGDHRGESGPEAIHLVELATGKDEVVGEGGFPEQPRWSPDGGTLYWVNEVLEAGQIRSFDVATRTVRKHPTAHFGVFNGPGRLGDRLLFSAGPTNAYCCREATLFTTDLAGSDMQRFGDFNVSGAAYPLVSPHGKKVAVEWNVREGGVGANWRLEITVLRADGRGARNLTVAFPRPFYSARGPAWSPDDRHLALTLSLCPYAGCDPSMNAVVLFDTDDPNPVPAFIGYGSGPSFGP